MAVVFERLLYNFDYQGAGLFRVRGHVTSNPIPTVLNAHFCPSPEVYAHGPTFSGREGVENANRPVGNGLACSLHSNLQLWSMPFASALWVPSFRAKFRMKGRLAAKASQGGLWFY